MSLIKYLFNKYGYKLLNKLGLYVSKLYSPQETYFNLERKPYEVKKQELKHLSFFVKSSRDHRYYNELLKLYVPDWEMNVDKAEFIGVGGGGGNLSSFRKIVFKGQPYFEKVYFSQSKDLQTIKWFDQHVSSKIAYKIRAPRIRKIFPGDLLTIVYLDFIELTPFDKSESEEELIKLTKLLFEIPIYSFKKEYIDIHNHLLDYTTHYLYQLNIGLVKKELIERNINFDKIERNVANSKRIITHGDFIDRNVAKENIIIDWDSFGFFPMGLDQAYLYYFIYLIDNKEPFLTPKQWVSIYYAELMDRESLRQFKFNFTFFLLVFAFRIFMLDRYLEVKELLCEDLSSFTKEV